MARVVVIENPQQRNGCLSSDMARYIARIPPRFQSFPEAVAALEAAPFVRDSGLEARGDGTCIPPQRSRIWPDSFNCWEATAHFAAEASRLLPDDWIVLIQDKTFGALRHVWPSLVFSGKLAPPGINPDMPIANAWYNDLFGGIHYAGDKVLRVFGAGGLSDQIAEAAGDSLPDWARTKEQLEAHIKEAQQRNVETPTENKPIQGESSVATVSISRVGAMDGAI